MTWIPACAGMTRKWRRAWKMNLIEDVNPDWRDLCDDLPL